MTAHQGKGVHVTREELQQIAGARMSDAELIERALDDALCLRKTGRKVVELIDECLRALGRKGGSGR